MINISSTPGAGALSQTRPHDEFLELCAISTSGELTEEERKRLEEHLAVCPSCCEALEQYQSVVDQAIPSIAASEESENLERDPSWPQERAEKALFDRLAREGKRRPTPKAVANNSSYLLPRGFAVSSESTWRHVWTLYAAGILLFVALSFFAYRIGMRRGSDIAKVVGCRSVTFLRTAHQLCGKHSHDDQSCVWFFTTRPVSHSLHARLGIGLCLGGSDSRIG